MSDDDGWRFDVDEVGDDASGDGTATDRERHATTRTTRSADDTRPDDDTVGEGVLGRNDGEFADPEPQSIAAENVFFVLLGAATMVGIIALLVV